jgi:opacity protein-like surface antigen
MYGSLAKVNRLLQAVRVYMIFTGGSMKLRAVCAGVVFLAATAVAAADSVVGFHAGIGSGYIFYGDTDVRNRISDMNGSSFSRFIIAGDFGADIKLADSFFFVTGGEVTADLFWNGSEHCNYLDYALLNGLKIYTGIGGLAVSADYAVGRRTDFVKTGTEDEVISSTGWGNGFQFEVDYDLSYGTGGWAPVFGAYWRYMPRGGSADNIVSVFVRLQFGGK